MPEKTRNLSDKILLFIKGIAMGAANKVPGVSGGLVAFVTGFYEELIYSLQKINRKALMLLWNGRFKGFYQYVNGRFLLLVFAGSTFSYFSVSRVLDYFLSNFELYVWASFFGMILGSIYYIAKDFNDFSRVNIISIIIGIVVGVSISFMSPAKENDNLWFVFFCGIIGVSGMTLPGLSGSFILILMGNYVLLLVDSVNELYKTIQDVFSWNFDFIHDQVRMRYMKIILSFGSGSVFGLVITSHILGFLLRRWHQMITALIIGFIAGSLGIVWPWKNVIYKTENGVFLYDRVGGRIVENYQRYLPNINEPNTWYAVFYIFIGFAILYVIDWYGNTKSKKI
jgi:putative membrane protein